jgi:ribosomal protein L40E
MSLGEVDTLNLLTDKLNKLFEESQGYYESFLDTNNLYKRGQLSDKEFFQKLGDYVVAYSALEFLSIKVIFELKKALDKMAGGVAVGRTQSPGLMPGMGGPGMMGGMGASQDFRLGSAQHPVGVPPSIISVKQGFSEPGTLPTPEQAMFSGPTSGTKHCTACGAQLRINAKFCVKCGTKI